MRQQYCITMPLTCQIYGYLSPLQDDNREDRVFLLEILSTKSQWDFSIGCWVIAENEICDKQRFMIVTFCSR